MDGNRLVQAYSKRPEREEERRAEHDGACRDVQRVDDLVLARQDDEARRA